MSLSGTREFPGTTGYSLGDKIKDGFSRGPWLPILRGGVPVLSLFTLLPSTVSFFTSLAFSLVSTFLSPHLNTSFITAFNKRS